MFRYRRGRRWSCSWGRMLVGGSLASCCGTRGCVAEGRKGGGGGIDGGVAGLGRSSCSFGERAVVLVACLFHLCSSGSASRSIGGLADQILAGWDVCGSAAAPRVPSFVGFSVSKGPCVIVSFVSLFRTFRPMPCSWAQLDFISFPPACLAAVDRASCPLAARSLLSSSVNWMVVVAGSCFVDF